MARRAASDAPITRPMQVDSRDTRTGGQVASVFLRCVRSPIPFPRGPVARCGRATGPRNRVSGAARPDQEPPEVTWAEEDDDERGVVVAVCSWVVAVVEAVVDAVV